LPRPSSRDHIFAQKCEIDLPFRFDADVAKVFSDMIQRSVPGYALTLQMIHVIAQQYAQHNSNLYDLGCSLGASTLAMRHGIQHSGCTLFAVDNSEPMLNQCRAILEKDDASTPITLLHQDILTTPIKQASIVTMNFTLQFIPCAQRDMLLQRIAKHMLSGGVLILSEKITCDNTEERMHHIELHEAFKRQQGYSNLEISQKRQALEHVLLPETLEIHRQRLLHAGFSSVHTWFQCFNFVSLIAYK